jgi:hypothetical protein
VQLEALRHQLIATTVLNRAVGNKVLVLLYLHPQDRPALEKAG